MKTVKACKVWYFNRDDKFMKEIFESEQIGRDWCERYGCEFFDSIEVEVCEDQVFKLK